MQIDLAGKIDLCFCSLDTKIAHSFNSLDDKLETKFKYLDEGVTCTRETLQVRHETWSSLRWIFFSFHGNKSEALNDTDSQCCSSV